MSALLNVTRKRTSPIEQPLRCKITITQKRWLLSTHLLSMAAWLGGGFCSLAFNIIALRTADPHLLNATFVFAETFDTFIVRGGAVGSLITGISPRLVDPVGPVQLLLGDRQRNCRRYLCRHRSTYHPLEQSRHFFNCRTGIRRVLRSDLPIQPHHFIRRHLLSTRFTVDGYRDLNL
jgi:hypothetical protein